MDNVEVLQIEGNVRSSCRCARFTFPLAVYALATLTLARMTGLTMFSVAGGGLVVALAIFWGIVASRTARGAWATTLFAAPCLKGAKAPVRFEADAV